MTEEEQNIAIYNLFRYNQRKMWLYWTDKKRREAFLKKLGLLEE